MQKGIERGSQILLLLLSFLVARKSLFSYRTHFSTKACAVVVVAVVVVLVAVVVVAGAVVHILLNCHSVWLAATWLCLGSMCFRCASLHVVTWLRRVNLWFVRCVNLFVPSYVSEACILLYSANISSYMQLLPPNPLVLEMRETKSKLIFAPPKGGNARPILIWKE